jgi:hypothetical protein
MKSQENETYFFIMTAQRYYHRIRSICPAVLKRTIDRTLIIGDNFELATHSGGLVSGRQEFEDSDFTASRSQSLVLVDHDCRKESDSECRIDLRSTASVSGRMKKASAMGVLEERRRQRVQSLFLNYIFSAPRLLMRLRSTGQTARQLEQQGQTGGAL